MGLLSNMAMVDLACLWRRLASYAYDGFGLAVARRGYLWLSWRWLTYGAACLFVARAASAWLWRHLAWAFYGCGDLGLAMVFMAMLGLASLQRLYVGNGGVWRLYVGNGGAWLFMAMNAYGGFAWLFMAMVALAWLWRRCIKL
jgi:hypothetical protein